MNKKNKADLEEMMGYFLAVPLIAVLMAWILVFCIAPFALLRLCSMVLLV